MFGFADDPKNRPVKDTAPGEYAIGDYMTGDYIYFKENGDLEVVISNNATVTIGGNADVTIAGNATATIGGDATVSVTGDISATAGGTVDIESVGIMTLTAPQINLQTPILKMSGSGSGTATMEGNINVTSGDITTDQEVTAAGKDLSVHIHDGVTTGAGNTGQPV
ncbi:unnamed protein product [marine sediment metagenome]|uniref:Uncharacterized protein n=1 Tax=marine sediment metagenome TaxID=412755 RepID=X0T8Y5_9ZZZZ